MTPDNMSNVQVMIQEAIKQSQGQAIPAYLVLLFVSLLVSAIGALWMLFRRLNSRLERMHQKAVADLEARVKSYEDAAAKSLPTDLHNEQIKAFESRIAFQEQLLNDLREEHSHINEKRLTESKEQVSLIVSAIKESTASVEQVTSAMNEVTDALRTVDLDVRTNQRMLEKLSGALELLPIVGGSNGPRR